MQTHNQPVISKKNKKIKDEHHFITFPMLQDKCLQVTKRGNGAIPLFWIGCASLFMKPGFIPDAIYDNYTIFFIDPFKKTSNEAKDYSHVTRDDFSDVTETARIELQKLYPELDLNQIALIAHSMTAILPEWYGDRYPEHTLGKILLDGVPMTGKDTMQAAAKFFEAHASKKLKTQHQAQQAMHHWMLKRTPATQPQKHFEHMYNADAFKMFHHPQSRDKTIHDLPTKIFDDIPMDMPLVRRLFSLSQYDLRTSASTIPRKVICGEKDYMMNPHLWTEFKKALDDRTRSIYGLEAYRTSITVVKGQMHFANFAHKQFTNLLNDFAAVMVDYRISQTRDYAATHAA